MREELSEDDLVVDKLAFCSIEINVELIKWDVLHLLLHRLLLLLLLNLPLLCLLTRPPSKRGCSVGNLLSCYAPLSFSAFHRSST